MTRHLGCSALIVVALANVHASRVRSAAESGGLDEAGRPMATADAAVSFAIAPLVLPRDTPLADYSPLVSIQYSGLGAGTYTLRTFLLETQTGGFLCASGQWCDKLFTIDNHGGTNSAGQVSVAQSMDVFAYSGFLWVADLYDANGIKVSSATQPATSTLNRAPVLSPIGNRSVAVNASLDFLVAATDADGDGFSLGGQNLPPGATFNGTTGAFHWQPSTAGTYSSIVFNVSQNGASALSDAEMIQVAVGPAAPSGALSFTLASYKTGERGPAVLLVTRTGGSAGAVTVSYSTINGSAMAGSDYPAVANGILTFGDGELTKAIRLATVSDTGIEPNETFQVQLRAPTGGATLGAQATATVTIVDDDTPSLAGQWGDVITTPTVPIHAHVLPHGKVMFWDRHNHDVAPMWDATPYLWDPANPLEFTTLPSPSWDIFCSGHALMADGRLFVAGGHLADFVGAPSAGIFDPITNAWTAVPNMNGGRWYPSVTTLPNGDMLVQAGDNGGYGDINPVAQVFQVSTGTWRNLSGAPSGSLPAWPDFYPFSYVAPNGKVFIAGPQQTARMLDTAGFGSSSDVATSGQTYRDYGTSVLYGPGKVLIVGGNLRDPSTTAPTILPGATAEVIDLTAAIPVWRSVASMAVGRRQLNATLLPDGKVLITGGTSAPGHDDAAGAVLSAEIWDPVAETFTPVAAHNRYRGYHSIAALLPDARVLIGGGGHPDATGGTSESNFEIYSPPYLFKGPRPVITSAPTTVGYGTTFSVTTPNSAQVTSVSWVRLSSVTHGFNENQRINQLSFTTSPASVAVTAPADANACPPGHYMLFIHNGNGVPSEARIVRITDGLIPSPAPAIALSGDLSFGSVPAGSTATRTLSITNPGTATLNVTGIAYPGGFTGPGAATVAPGASASVVVTFGPASRGSYGGVVTVSGNHTSGTNTIAASGTGVPVPGDVNGDGFADLVWRNGSTGANVIWHLNDTTLVGQASLPTVTDPTWRLVASADINEDGHLDVVWRNAMSGANVVWYLNGDTLLGQANLPSVADPTWQIVASADINRDGHADLLWRNTTSGANVVWFLYGATLIGQMNLPSASDPASPLVAAADLDRDGLPELIFYNTHNGGIVVRYLDGNVRVQVILLPTADPTWRLVAALDLDRDGWPDLVWRSRTSGESVVWFLRGELFLRQESLPTVADLTWQPLGSALPEVPVDVNGDRHPDLIWRNRATGANRVWYLHGTALIEQPDLPAVPDLSWQLVAKADVNGDTRPDLIWRNSSTGANRVWYLNGTTLLGQADLPSVADGNWRIVGAADINGDTRPDLVWRNVATGADVVWFLNGVTLLSQANLLTVTDLAWQIVAVADIDGDARPDLVWHNPVSGANVVWYLNGTTFISQASLPTVADTTWQITGAADVNGDGHPDLIWRNTGSGANVVWYLSGTTFLGQANLPTVPDTNWILRPGS